MPADASIVSALSELHRYGAVDGVCLLYQDFIVANHLPISDKKANLIGATVTEMCDGYQAVGRNITEFYFGYDQCQLFVFCEGAVRLVIILESEADLDQVGQGARAFLAENRSVLKALSDAHLTQRIKVPAKEPERKESAPEEEPEKEEPSVSVAPVAEPVEKPDEWIVFREKLHQLLSRVLGSGQSSRLIDRVVKEHGYGKRNPLQVDFESIGNALVEKVPNKSKRRGLQSLLTELYKHYR